MKFKPELKGYFFALLAVFAMANVYIFSKAALQEMSMNQFGIYWFSFGFIWIMLFALYKKTFSHVKDLSKKTIWILVFLGLSEVVGTYYFYRAIQEISNPSIVAFIGNVSPAFVIMLSIFIFKERFNWLESIGILLALFGAFIISYQGNISWSQMFIFGAHFVLISSFLSAINAIVIKHNIAKLNPIIITINRITFLLVFYILIFDWRNESLSISNKGLVNVLIGSFVGPFLAGVAGYMSYQYIKVSRKAIIDSFRGLLVLIGAFTYFGKFPEKIALVGGLISIVGVLFIAIGKMKLSKKD